VITRCHARVDLRLRVFAPDVHGFHGVETLIARADLADSLEIEETGSGVAIEVDGAEVEGVPTDEGNLCCAAVREFMAEAFRGRRSAPGVMLRLTKRVPPARGLGGGSMDAAATLRLLSARWPILGPRRLFALAARLGRDVAFGLLDVPLALGWERGGRLLPLRPPRSRPGLLCCPPFGVSTRDAYSWLRETREVAGAADPAGGAAALPGATRLAKWDSIESLIRNDLEGPVVARHPELKRALELLRGASPAAAMSGSGSTLFAVFQDEANRGAAGDAMRASGCGEVEGWRVLDVRLPT